MGVHYQCFIQKLMFGVEGVWLCTCHNNTILLTMSTVGIDINSFVSLPLSHSLLSLFSLLFPFSLLFHLLYSLP